MVSEALKSLQSSNSAVRIIVPTEHFQNKQIVDITPIAFQQHSAITSQTLKAQQHRQNIRFHKVHPAHDISLVTQTSQAHIFISLHPIQPRAIASFIDYPHMSIHI